MKGIAWFGRVLMGEEKILKILVSGNLIGMVGLEEIFPGPEPKRVGAG